jgi:hypothetical protein
VGGNDVIKIDDALEKKFKPDFEAAFVHDGRVWILGSGSRPNRCGIARIDDVPVGVLAGEPAEPPRSARPW